MVLKEWGDGAWRGERKREREQEERGRGGGGGVGGEKGSRMREGERKGECDRYKYFNL